jgi:uncharacterized protein involved in exopolysaccharide biosynthesis
LRAKQPGLENIQLLREVKYQQMLFEMLAKQYEVARLDEAKDAAIIQVLDPAIEPERNAKPKRAIIVVVASLAALLIGVFWAFFAEARKRLATERTSAAQLAELKAHMRF